MKYIVYIFAFFHLNSFAFSQSNNPVSDSLIITGKITNRNEIWDRRTNTLMGRPDFLTEIIFDIQVQSVRYGNMTASIVTANVKDQNMLARCNALRKCKTAIFTLVKKENAYLLVQFDSLAGQSCDTVIKKVEAPVKNNPQPVITDSLKMLELKPGREIANSKDLQKKAVRLVAKKFGFKNAEFISLTSFSGPMPPDGGYVYWGVKGQKKGKWYVWQAGYNDKLVEGTALNDPGRYKK